MINDQLPIRYSSRFKKDAKRFRNDRVLLGEIDHIIGLIARRQPLPERCRDHALIGGEYHGYRDCHVRPDVVLLYAVDATEVYLLRIGSHSELNL